MEGTSVIPLSCGHSAVFTNDSLLRNGIPSRWYCGRCRVTSDVVSQSTEVREVLKKLTAKEIV